MSAPCRSCGRALDDCGTCVCWSLRAAPPAPEVQDVTLYLGGTPAPLKCTGCGRAYTFIKDFTTLEHCYFCHRLQGAS